MLYTLIVKPIALAALGAVIWVIWRSTVHLDPADARRARIATAAGGIMIAALILGPPAWDAITTRPGEVAAWAIGLAAVGALVWAYARLIAAARRKASGKGRR